MRPLRHLIALLAPLAVIGCTELNIQEHVTAPNIAVNLQRVVVLNRLDASYDEVMSDSFAAAIVPALAQCNVATLVYKPNSMELNAAANFRASLQSFKPDAFLNIQQTVRFERGSAVAGNYMFTLHQISPNRDLWKAVIHVGAGAKDAYMRDVGTRLAAEVTRTMAADNVLKTCPPSPRQGA